jgi:very-short-patch-repair endonuclease
MGRTAFVPVELTRGPFTIDQARHAGLERWHLEGASWRRVGPATYIWAGLEEQPLHLLEAARRRLPPGAAFCGCTAAWLHGLDVAPCSPIEVTVPENAGVSARSGMAVRRSTLRKGDIVLLRGLPATSMARTLAELCGRSSLTEAVVLADSALHLGRVRLEDLQAWVKSNRKRHGIANLRRVITLADPAAESHMESRLRMLLVLAGLPRPKAQVSIYDRHGRFAGRPDLYYEEHRLGIEYDGGVHRDALVDDNRRQNRLLNAGVRLLRFTGADVLGNPETVVTQVRAMLAAPTAEPVSTGRNGFEARGKPVSAGGFRFRRTGAYSS